MNQHIYRVLFSVVMAVASITTVSVAQTPSPENEYFAVVTENSVPIRCGAAESYYRFGNAKSQQFVKVTGEKFNWARVAAAGPAFKETYAFIKYATDDPSRFRVSPDGTSGVTLGRTDLVAPNLDAKANPTDSWKTILRVDADQTLTVLETTQTDRDTIHRVVLPEAAHGWISLASLRKASDAEAKQFAQALIDMREHAIQPKVNQAIAQKPTIPRPGATNETTGVKPVAQMPPAIKETTVATTPTEILPGDAMPTTEAAPTVIASAIEPTPEFTQPAVAPEPAPPSLENLEAAYARLRREPIDTAEVGPLRDLFIDLAERSHDEPRTMRYAYGRSEQLQIWAEIQQKRTEINQVAHRMKMSAAEAEAVRIALERSAEYAGVGRIAASTIYDGVQLPKLLRLQDSGTGRTVAYLKPDEDFELVNLIGNIVGIIGDKQYDEILRLNILEPKHIDLLAPKATTEIVPAAIEPGMDIEMDTPAEAFDTLDPEK